MVYEVEEGLRVVAPVRLWELDKSQYCGVLVF